MKALFVVLFLFGSVGVYAESDSMKDLTGVNLYEVSEGVDCSSDFNGKREGVGEETSKKKKVKKAAVHAH